MKRVLSIILVVVMAITVLPTSLLTVNVNAASEVGVTQSGNVLYAGWSAVDGATSYKVDVYKDTTVVSSQSVTTNSAGYTVTSAGNYQFVVTANGTDGITTYTSAVTAATYTNSTTSGGLTFTRSGTTVTISWTANTNAASYNVTYSVGNANKGTWNVIGTSFVINDVPATSSVSATVTYNTSAGQQNAGTIGTGSITGTGSTTGSTGTDTGTGTGTGTATSYLSVNNRVVSWASFGANSTYTVRYYYGTSTTPSTTYTTATSITVPTGVTKVEVLWNGSVSLGTVTFPTTSSTGTGLNTVAGTRTIWWNSVGTGATYSIYINGMATPYQTVSVNAFVVPTGITMVTVKYTYNGTTGTIGSLTMSSTGTSSGTTDSTTTTGTTATIGTNCTVISSATSSTVTWNASAGATYYKVYYIVDGKSQATAVTGTSVVIPVGNSTAFTVLVVDSSNNTVAYASVAKATSTTTSTGTAITTGTAAFSTVEFTIPIWAQYGYAVAGDSIKLSLPSTYSEGEYSIDASYVVVANGVSYSLGLNDDGVYEIVFGTLSHGYNTTDKNTVIPQSTVVGDNAALTVIGTFSIARDSDGKEVIRVSAADFKYYTDPSENNNVDSKFTTTFNPTTQRYDVKAVSNDNPASVTYCWDWNPVDGVDIEAPALAGGTCGDNLTWILTDDGVLTISGTGAMKNYTYSSSSPWYSYISSIKSVIIENGVTSIGDYAFRGCSSLTSITIPDSVTSIGNYAFYYCSSLTSVTIPDSVTSIGDYAFQFCTSLTSITIGDSVTSIGSNAFDSCSSLTSVSIPDSVTSMGSYAFSNCINLTSINVPKSITDINKSALSGCKSLNKIVVSEDHPTYSSINGILYNKNGTILIFCPPGMEESDLTFNPETIIIGPSAFANCSKLTNVVIPEGVKVIGNYAFNTSILKDITIPASVTSIGNGAFNRDYSYIMPTESTEEETTQNSQINIHISDLAAWCNVSLSQTIGNYHLYLENNLITDLAIPSGVAQISSFVFSNCSSIESVTIPESVKEIGNYAFFACTSLTDMMILPGVESIGQSSFGNCANLTGIILPISLKTIASNAFSSTSITSLAIPSSVESINTTALAISTLKEVRFMSPYTEIVGSSIPNSVIIYGFEDSTAQQWAQEYGRVFVVLDFTGDHSWDNGTIVSKASCVLSGLKTFTCTDCGETKTEIIPATGEHVYGDWVKYDSDDHIHYCINTGCESYELEAHAWHNDSDIYCEYCEYTRLLPPDSPKLLATSVMAYPGGKAIVTVRVKNCDLVDAIGLSFTYDSSVLTFEPGGTRWINDDAQIAEFDYDQNNAAMATENLFDPNYVFAHLCFIVNENASFGDVAVDIEAILKNGSETVTSISTSTKVTVTDLMAGDTSGDGSVDKNDAIYLLYSVLFGDTKYPLNQSCDFNGDGSVDKNDAIYLLYHALFGAASYPLN